MFGTKPVMTDEIYLQLLSSLTDDAFCDIYADGDKADDVSGIIRDAVEGSEYTFTPRKAWALLAHAFATEREPLKLAFDQQDKGAAHALEMTARAIQLVDPTLEKRYSHSVAMWNPLTGLRLVQHAINDVDAWQKARNVLGDKTERYDEHAFRVVIDLLTLEVEPLVRIAIAEREALEEELSEADETDLDDENLASRC